jgi:hypothetical protein
MLMAYLHTKFQIPSWNGSFIIAIRQEAKEQFHKILLKRNDIFV